MQPGFRLLAPLLAWCLLGLSGLSAPGPNQEAEQRLTPLQLQQNLAAKKYSGHRIDLVFAKTGLQEVMAELKKVSGMRLDLDPAINDPVTYRMLDVPWDEALAAVIADNDLHMSLKLDATGFNIGRGKMLVLAMSKPGQARFILFLYNHLISIGIGIAILAAGAVALWILGRRRARRRKAGKKPLLAPEAAAQVKDRLIRAIKDERLYRDEALTLQTLSEKMAVSPHQLSWIINQEMGQSFSSLVNGYRIEEVKSLLADPKSNGGSVLQMAMEAGFNSKAAFNRAFKAHTGMTPSQYKRRVSH